MILNSKHKIVKNKKLRWPDSYQLYATVIDFMRQLSDLSDSYRSSKPVIWSFQHLPAVAKKQSSILLENADLDKPDKTKY